MRLLISRWGGWGALAAGAVLCAIGWYGVSGERFAARQLPYLASCTVPGAALIVAGAVLLAAYGPEARAGEDRGEGEDGGVARTDREGGRDRPYDAEAEAEPDASAGPGPEPARDADTPGELLAVPAGRLVHRAACPLVDGKPEAVPATAETVAERGLRGCPVCEPALPAAAPRTPTRPPEG